MAYSAGEDEAAEASIEAFKRHFPCLIIVGIGPNEVLHVVRAIKAGAVDYVSLGIRALPWWDTPSFD